MVHTTVRPVLTVLRTVRITMAAARASKPAARRLVQSKENPVTGLHPKAPSTNWLTRGGLVHEDDGGVGD